MIGGGGEGAGADGVLEEPGAASWTCPSYLKPILWPLMFVIEVAGLFIKHIVLAVRLFANMMAGHIVLAVILGFIAQAAGIFVYLVTPASIAGRGGD